MCFTGAQLIHGGNIYYSSFNYPPFNYSSFNYVSFKYPSSVLKIFIINLHPSIGGGGLNDHLSGKCLVFHFFS